MTEPRGLAALLLAGAGLLLLARWVAHRRRRARVVRQLRALSRTPGSGTRAAQEILRRRDDPSSRWVERALRFNPFLRDMEQLLEQAGLPWKRSTVARAGLGTGLLLAMLTLALVPSLAAVGAALVVGGLLPRLYVMRRKAQRVRAFEAQLPEAIDLLSRAIRAGHGVGTGLRTVAEESEEPIATEFRRVFEEQKYGLPFEESLLALTRRVDLIDLRVMVVAILVQREVGGNLTEILDKIARLIRTRFTLRRQLRVHTAQGRYSGHVLTLLPIVVAVVFSLVDPEYMGVLLHDPIGQAILVTAALLQVMGYLWIWKILRMEI